MYNKERLDDNPFGLAGIRLAILKTNKLLFHDQYTPETIVQVKYTPDEINQTVSKFIKDNIGISVEVYLDLEDTIDYDLYFIRLDVIDEKDTSKLEEYFNVEIDQYHEMTRSIINKMFKGYVSDDYVESRMGKIENNTLITFEFTYEDYKILLDEYVADKEISSLKNK